MKKPTKAKAAPKAEPEIYYGIEALHTGGIDIISNRSTIEEVENDIREYVDEEEAGAFLIVKQVKALRVTRKIELKEDKTMRLESDEFYQLADEDVDAL
jgi:hypothetical protein